MSASRPAFLPPDHDHRSCRDAVLARAERHCAEQALRLTPHRRRVLEIVAGGHTAIGAYDILAKMTEDGKPPAPVVVYRALDFLVEQGFVHRVESLNAYIACAGERSRHTAQFLICHRCRMVAELSASAIDAAIATSAQAIGFAISSSVVEIGGLCRTCRAADG